MCGDDGVGPRVIEALEKEDLPQNVTLYRADVSGLDLLKFFPGYTRVIIIDASDMKLPPGAVRVFKASEIKEADFNDKFSTHGLALLETLTLARELEIDSDISIVGVQPLDTSFNLSMSQKLESCVPSIVKRVKNLI